MKCLECKSWDMGCVNDINPCRNYSQFKPKEKPMESKITFNSVKSFCDFCFVIFGIMPKPEEIEEAQLSGFIRKSPVEEAEEMRNRYNSSDYIFKQVNDLKAIMHKDKKAIQYLKSENERLEKILSNFERID